MIKFEGVKKVFGNQVVVNNLNFTVNDGETFCLLGKSGSGKTTTLKMINRLIDHDGGIIRINGKEIGSIDKIHLRRNTGYIIQDVGLFPHMTVGQNIAVPLKLANWNTAKIKPRLHQLIVQIGLEESFLDRYPGSLSGGQQQRVGIARAIAVRPVIILMDEPFSALDPILREQMQQDFLHMSELQEMTKVVVTHDVQEALTLADRICIIEQGEARFIGTKHELLQSKDPLVRNFLGDNRFIMKLKTQTVGELVSNLTPVDATEGVLTVSSSDTVFSISNVDANHIEIKESNRTFKKNSILLAAISNN